MPVIDRNTTKPRRMVISLGGLALGDGLDRQLVRVREVAPALLRAIDSNAEVILTHGNGPQINMAQRTFAVASTLDTSVPVIDLPECGAMTQGYIGYHLQQAIGAEMHKTQKNWHVATVTTQIEVEPDDPSLTNPTKQIGPHLTREQAETQAASDPTFKFVKDGNKGYRRVVASPRPRRIVESDSILNLLDNDFIVIACGGGGIPVVRDSDNFGCYKGIPAVIEKDSAASLLGENCDADELIFLTDVEGVYLNFGKDNQALIRDMTVSEAHAHLKSGEFGADNMGVKIQAALRFLECRPDRSVTIGALERAQEVVSGNSGTHIHY